MFNFTPEHDQWLIAIVHDTDCTADSKLLQWAEDNGVDFCYVEDRLSTLGYDRCVLCEYWFPVGDLEDTPEGAACSECTGIDESRYGE